MPLPKSRLASLVARSVSAAFVAATLSLGLLVAQPAQAGSVVIRDFVLTHGISEREPMGTTEDFAVNDERGYAFARLHNDGTPTNVSFVWEIDNTVHASIDMSVGTSSGWRTWSSVALRPGTWRVKLMDESGLMLAEKTFTIGDNNDSMQKTEGSMLKSEGTMQKSEGTMQQSDSSIQ